MTTPANHVSQTATTPSNHDSQTATTPSNHVSQTTTIPSNHVLSITNENELSKTVGLPALKSQVEKVANGRVWNERRRAPRPKVAAKRTVRQKRTSKQAEGMTNNVNHVPQTGACSAKMHEIENELSKIVGLHELKSQVHKWAKGMLLDEQRRALGLKIAARPPLHMAFLGNPGTGKTSVARLLGKLLHLLGTIPTDKFIEVQRTDLVGEYIGQTGPKTRAKIQEAEGGILFVDEAYSLIPLDPCRDFGVQALEEIMSFMDSGKVVVIFAGYSEPMKRVISSNEGLSRRVTKFFHFDDFSCEDLANILHLKMSNQADENSPLYGFKLHPSCSVKAVAAMIKRETTEKQRNMMNGGLVDKMLVNARENLDSRIDVECKDTNSLLTITSKDLRAGLRSLTDCETFAKPAEKRRKPEEQKETEEQKDYVVID